MYFHFGALMYFRSGVDTTAARRDRPCVSMVQRSVGGSGAVDRRDSQARTSYGPSCAARDAAGVPGAQDCRGDRRRPAARRPQHSSDDPENRTPPALECAAASSGIPIDSRGRSCLRQAAFFPRTLLRKMSAASQMDMPKSRTENFKRFSSSAAAVGILRVHGRA
jgi:hypothetical protein